MLDNILVVRTNLNFTTKNIRSKQSKKQETASEKEMSGESSIDIERRNSSVNSSESNTELMVNESINTSVFDDISDK